MPLVDSAKFYNKVYCPKTWKENVYIVGNSNRVKQIAKDIKRARNSMDIVDMDKLMDSKMRNFTQRAARLVLHNPKISNADITKALKENQEKIALYAFALRIKEYPDAIFYGKNMEHIISYYVNPDIVYLSPYDGLGLDGCLILCDKVESNYRYQIEDYAFCYMGEENTAADLDKFMDYVKGKTDTYESMNVEANDNLRYMYESLIGLEGLVDDDIY